MSQNIYIYGDSLLAMNQSFTLIIDQVGSPNLGAIIKSDLNWMQICIALTKQLGIRDIICLNSLDYQLMNYCESIRHLYAQYVNMHVRYGQPAWQQNCVVYWSLSRDEPSELLFLTWHMKRLQ